MSGGLLVRGPDQESGTTPLLEQRSIEVIPEGERHGHVSSLFTIWSGSNLQVLTVVTGALAVIAGLSLPLAIVAIVLGNLVGAVFMSLHAAQGPKLGMAQMIQSRGQFGFYGAILPMLIVVVMYMGFFFSVQVLAGEALASMIGVSVTVGIILASVVAYLLATVGYNIIHYFERTTTVISGLLFVWLTVNAITSSGHHSFAPTESVLGLFLLAFFLAATYQLSYAPYISDYSRYLPTSTSVRAAFAWTYAGTLSSGIWLMVLGAVLAAKAGAAIGSNPVGYFAGEVPGGVASWLVAIVFVVGLLGANVLNLYGPYITGTTIADTVRPVRVRARGRALIVLGFTVVGTLMAIFGAGSFLTDYSNFLALLLYFIIPWTAVNLLDFYVVRREKYDIKSLFAPGGIYGGVGWHAMAAYLGAIVLEIPFMNTTFYEGPGAKMLGGGDVTWIVGLLVAGVIYWVLSRGLMAAESRKLGELQDSADA